MTWSPTGIEGLLFQVPTGPGNWNPCKALEESHVDPMEEVELKYHNPAPGAVVVVVKSGPYRIDRPGEKLMKSKV